MHLRALILTILLAPALHAQQPEVLHTQVVTESATSGLASAIAAHLRAAQPTWLGYNIPLTPGINFDGYASGALDLTQENTSYTRDDSTTSNHPTQAVVLLRVEQGAVNRIRLVDPARKLDAGNLPFIWLTGVTPADSIRELVALARMEPAPRDHGEHRIRGAALFAIAAHNVPEANRTLIDLMSPANSADLREKAAFWLASQGGHEGFLAIQKDARNDPDPAYRKKLVFDVNISKDPAALDELIHIAHSDSAPEVRKQAQFWMANKGGKKVAGDLSNSALNDPDSAIRKQAVFAISRLPGDEATARLIELTNTSKDPAVRKQAVFWLGQSKDPQALEFLTNLIKQ